MSTAQIHIPGYVVGTWDIDPLHTEVGFSVRHLMVSKVRGRFTRFEGSFITATDPLNSSASAAIDMTSIDTNNPTRDDDLRSKNFFEVDQYPQMTYRSTGLRLDG
jgi:polyisoprenoid-binding protein YceI